MDREIRVKFDDATGKQFTFEQLHALCEFAKQERDFWKAQRERVKDAYGSVYSYTACHMSFEQIVDAIEGIAKKLESLDDEQLDREVSVNLVRNMPSSYNYIWSGHSFVKPLIDCHVNHGPSAGDAFDQLVVHNIFPKQIQGKEVFFGLIAGYEFLSQDSAIVNRRDGGKTFLNHLRNQLAEVEGFKADYIEWYGQAQHTITSLQEDFEKSGSKQVKEQSEQFAEKLKAWKQTMGELEETYEKKLRLSKPAEYWRNAAKKFKWQGGLLSSAIFISLFAGCAILWDLFATWLHGQELAIQLDTLQGAVLFATMVAIYAFLIRVLSRLAFSSFHLMRDAEEREQLTYLYLALSRETDVSSKETTEIVLQALFSRSTTGLLAQDHGPTIPGTLDAIHPSRK